MRDRRLLHRKGTFKVTHADLAAASHQDVEDGQSHRMTEEFEVGAHPLERVQIDARTPTGSTPRTPASVWDLNDDTGRSLRHGGTLSNTSTVVNAFVVAPPTPDTVSLSWPARTVRLPTPEPQPIACAPRCE
jgi:hypothetical protein